jgi:hypothetical protein
VRTFTCRCGNTLFFDNSLCLACASEVGWCPRCRAISALVPGDEGGFTCGNADCGARLAKCANYAEHEVCNRAVPAEEAAGQPLCDCCRLNVTIPDLSVPGNLYKWYRLEAAKRRLFYDLDLVGLPHFGAADGVEFPLGFDFKADVIPKADFWRTNTAAERVYTGHAGGRITINIREADDVVREKLRVEMDEAHRTLIGHFRHEIGHYYWDLLVKDQKEPACIAVFGDHNDPPYAEALERHYAEGPPPDWQERHISAYASMHPWEDFAETWAAYLDMASALDTAHHNGFGGEANPTDAEVDSLLVRYQRLGIALNEINRAIGLIDLVPEVFVPPVVGKLRFIHELVRAAGSAAAAAPPLGAPAVDQAPAKAGG